MTLVTFYMPPPACRMLWMLVLPLYHSSTSSRCRILCSMGCILSESVSLMNMMMLWRECSWMPTAIISNTLVIMFSVDSSVKMQLGSSEFRCDVQPFWIWRLALLVCFLPGSRYCLFISDSTCPCMPVSVKVASLVGDKLIVHMSFRSVNMALASWPVGQLASWPVGSLVLLLVRLVLG
jgi:hypothetical protein